VFEDKDANGNKLCEPAEFINVLQQLGVDLSETQANAAFTDCDTTGRGEVTFNEFLMWWGENENKMRAAHHDETLWDAARDAQTRIGQVEVAVQDLQRDMTEALKLVGA
jgi:Ca2+-binding EF-hand superfamily protein